MDTLSTIPVVNSSLPWTNTSSPTHTWSAYLKEMILTYLRLAKATLQHYFFTDSLICNACLVVNSFCYISSSLLWLPLRCWYERWVYFKRWCDKSKIRSWEFHRETYIGLNLSVQLFLAIIKWFPVKLTVLFLEVVIDLYMLIMVCCSLRNTVILLCTK